MIDFIEREKFYFIVRLDAGEGRPTRLGRLSKEDWVVASGVKAQLSAEELAELEAFVGLQKQGDELERRLSVIRFPTMLRQVAEYYANGASSLEQKLIAKALRDATRRVRRADPDRPTRKKGEADDAQSSDDDASGNDVPGTPS